VAQRAEDDSMQNLIHVDQQIPALDEGRHAKLGQNRDAERVEREANKLGTRVASESDLGSTRPMWGLGWRPRAMKDSENSAIEVQSSECQAPIQIQGHSIPDRH
jgi:hypothetical protein